jgi:biopolymer transport protein ExbD
MSMFSGNKHGVKSDINITPYIDILLVLLIIFMVVVPLKQYDHPVQVPQPAPKVQPPPQVKPDTIIVDMDLDRTIRLNTQPITMDKLESTLTQVFSRRAVKNVFIRGDSSLPYGAVFPLLDLAKRSGATDIALLQKQDSKNASTGASTFVK